MMLTVQKAKHSGVSVRARLVSNRSGVGSSGLGYLTGKSDKFETSDFRRRLGHLCGMSPMGPAVQAEDLATWADVSHTRRDVTYERRRHLWSRVPRTEWRVAPSHDPGSSTKRAAQRLNIFSWRTGSRICAAASAPLVRDTRVRIFAETSSMGADVMYALFGADPRDPELVGRAVDVTYAPNVMHGLRHLR
jgi:hypothetical protein